jgi:hypothetical protein
MRRGIFAAGVLGALLACGVAQAFYLDESQSIQMTGKVFTQASFRTVASDSSGVSCYPFGANCQGFTFPDTRGGQLIQHRNLLDLEMYHNVAKGLGSQFTLLDQLGYRLRVKWFYDGVYDYGPRGYSHAGDTAMAANPIFADSILGPGLRKNRDLDTQKNPLWNAYVDLGKGPVKFRVGRQDLSWGESDGFRLLDMIEPLDNRFGFPLVEDLDDRRIPLWMVRPTMSLGNWGHLRNLTLDGYWVPGSIDNEIAPVSPVGNPFGVGAPPGPSEVIRPSKNLGNSRGGGRLIGTAGDVTFSLAHYVTFNDIPSVRLKADGLAIAPLGGDQSLFAPNGSFLVELYQQQITGGSATFALPFDPYTIIRMEAANFWDERVFMPGKSVDSALPADKVGACIGGFFADGTRFCPDVKGVGELPTKDVMRWMIGADRNVWIRWLNPENTFFFSAQYFHTHIFDYEKGMANAVPSNTHFVPLGPGLPINTTTFDWVARLEDEFTFTYAINTLVYHGTIQPGVFGLYDARGVNGVVPSISYQYGSNLVLTMKYAITRGTLAGLGFFRDRDQLLFRVQYNLS